MPLRDIFHLHELCNEISLPEGWRVEEVLSNGSWFIRVVSPWGTDNITGEPLSWTGRKWYVSPHSTISEVIQTALKAYLTALEHEAREQFKWRGVAVFDPHLDLEVVVSFQRLTSHRKDNTKCP